jgi:hypothetical protein
MIITYKHLYIHPKKKKKKISNKGIEQTCPRRQTTTKSTKEKYREIHERQQKNPQKSSDGGEREVKLGGCQMASSR